MEKFKTNLFHGILIATLVYILGLFFSVELILKGIGVLVGLFAPLILEIISGKKLSQDNSDKQITQFINEDFQEVYHRLDALREEVNRVENMALTSQVSLSYLKQSDVLEKITILETRIKAIELKLGQEQD